MAINKQFSCLKGLAIIGVVVGHVGFYRLELFMNYWHLPIFYFVSGYFFKHKHIDNPKDYIVGRISRLLIPYLLFGIVAILSNNLLIKYGIITSVNYSFTDILLRLKDLILHLSLQGELVGATWFLVSLFFVSLFAIAITFLMQRCCKSVRYEWGGVILCIIGIIGIVCHLPSMFFWWANMFLAGLFFLGYACSNNRKLENLISSPTLAVISVVVMLVCMASYVNVGCQYFSIYNITVWHPLLFVLGIIAGFTLNSRIYKSYVGSIIAYIGEYSFSIMALHFTAFKIVTLIHKQFDSQVDVRCFPTSHDDLIYWAPLYIVMGIALPILCSCGYSCLLKIVSKCLMKLKNTSILTQ